MFNVIIVAALLTLAVLVVTLERRARKLHNDNVKIWQRVNRMANEIANLNAALLAVDGNVTAVEAKTAALKTQVADLASQVGAGIDPAEVQAAADKATALNGRIEALVAST